MSQPTQAQLFPELDELFRDHRNWDFRPRSGSALVDAGRKIDGVADTAQIPDIGAYEFGDTTYWTPGRQYDGPTTPVPPACATGVRPDADLMFPHGKDAPAHEVFGGESANDLRSVARLGGNSNIFFSRLTPGGSQARPVSGRWWRPPEAARKAPPPPFGASLQVVPTCTAPSVARRRARPHPHGVILMAQGFELRVLKDVNREGCTYDGPAALSQGSTGALAKGQGAINRVAGALLGGGSTQLAKRSTACPAVRTQPNFNLASYISGRWYIQQQMPTQYLAKTKFNCVSAEYTLKVSPTFWGWTITVSNQAVSDDGEPSGGDICAEVPDDGEPAKLRVAPGFLPALFGGP